MAVKIADTVQPLGNFPGMMAEHLNMVKDDGSEKSLQEMYEDGELGGDGLKDYTKLNNKPQINGVELSGDKLIPDLDMISDDEENILEIGSDNKLFAKAKEDGIIAKGNIRGVRASVPSVQVPATTWTKLTMQLLDGDDSMINADGNFVAPEDGLYLIVARPSDSVGSFAIPQIVSVNKGTEYAPETALAYIKTNTTTGSAFSQATGLAKLSKKDVVSINVFISSSQTVQNQSEDMPCEFYLISQNVEGLVAQATYELKSSWPASWETTTYASSSNEDVISLDGTITLPEEGNYILSWDSLMPQNYTNHTVHMGLSRSKDSTAIIDWLWYQTFSHVQVILAGTQVISGKAGDEFYLKDYHSAAQSGKTYIDEVKNHGVRLFRMGGSASGSPGTLDYGELKNKPTINDVEIKDNLTTEDLVLLSEDENNGLILGEDGNLFVDDKSADLERLEYKTDRINIAQKTVNDVGSISLLTDSVDVEVATDTVPAVTVLDKDISLRGSIEDFDYVDILLKPTDPINMIPQPTRVRVDEINYNDSPFPVTTDSSTLVAAYNADVSTKTKPNEILHNSFFMWFKDNRTLFLKQINSSITKTSFKDERIKEFSDYTSRGAGASLNSTEFKKGTSSLYVNGSTTGYVRRTVPELNFGTDDFTAQCWIKATTTGTYGCVFGTTNNVDIQIYIVDGYQGNNIGVQAGGSRVINTGKKFTKWNQWVHIALERYNKKFYMYEDGVLIGQSTSSSDAVSGSLADLTFGINSASSTWYRGYIDEFVVYDRAVYQGQAFTPSTDIPKDFIYYSPFEPDATTDSVTWEVSDVIGVNDRSMTIDPVEYVNDTQGIEDMPIGTIVDFKGVKDIKHYLKCDGSTYNIEDYPHLAQYFKDQYEVYNPFGGDGVTTFKVPDYRSGVSTWLTNNMTSATSSGRKVTASSTYPSYDAYKAFDGSASTGWHSQASAKPIDEWLKVEFDVPTCIDGFKITVLNAGNNQAPKNFAIQGSNNDSTWHDLVRREAENWSGKSSITYELDKPALYKFYRIRIWEAYAASVINPYITEWTFRQGVTTDRYIKYEPAYFMELNQDAYMGLYYNDYSSEEKVIGRWYDGKPVYRKFFNTSVTLTAGTWATPITNDFKGDQPVSAILVNAPSKHIIDGGVDVQFYTSDNKVYLRSPLAYNATGFYLEYTKTTDAPNSFDISMIFDQYSTEQLVELPVTDAEIAECLKGVM